MTHMTDEKTVLSFTYRIDHAQQRQYLRIPIQVETDTEKLEIAYDYIRRREAVQGNVTQLNEVNIVDLALEDASGALVGASGSERKSILIHENYATPGYRGVPLTPGTWHIVLGAYLIEDDGCPVSVTVTQYRKQDVLLRGDCHCHTEHSDGWYTVEDVISRARQDRLDYLFITDHNSMASNPLIRSYPDLTVLPGVEVTYYDGHYNLFGKERPIRTYVANSREEVLNIMAEGRRAGALSSINHPIDFGCGWKFGFSEDVPADMVEIWNGPFAPWAKGCIDMWHDQLCKGRIWPAIGGSDCHHVELMRSFATPTTFLYSKSRAGSDILDAMRQGHAFIGMTASAPRIFMACADARMGDVCRERGTLCLSVEALSQTDEVLLIDQTGVVFRDTPGRCAKYVAEFAVRNSRFIRAEVWRNTPIIDRTLASISNPIYFR